MCDTRHFYTGVRKQHIDDRPRMTLTCDLTALHLVTMKMNSHGPVCVSLCAVDVQFYVRPLLEYCSCVWSAHFKDGIYKVESVQRNFTKRLIRRNVSLVFSLVNIT